MKGTKLLTICSIAALLAIQTAAGQCTTNANTGVTPNLSESTSPPGQRSIHGTDNISAQTFTVLGSGCLKLSSITFSAAKGGNQIATRLVDLTVALYLTDMNGAPTGAAVTTTTVSQLDIGTSLAPVTATFAVPPQIAGGVKYAAVFSQAGGTGQAYYFLGLAAGNPYAGGSFYRWASTNGWSNSGQSAGRDVALSICVSSCTTVCVRGQGYFKKAEHWPSGVTGLTLGTGNYSQNAVINILNTPASGNALTILAYQLIAAKLNQLNGADVPAGVAAAIAAADALIGSAVVGSDYWPANDNPTALSLKDTLETYNEGHWSGGPAACQ